MLCRDRCGYCTFAQPPARLESPYLTPDQVLAIAAAGAAAGCHEALFTLGEGPEDRYPVGARVARRARLRLHRRLPRGHGPARARRDRPAPPRQRRRARPRRARPAPDRRAEPGDDDRVAPRRPRLPPRRARQDARPPAGHPRGRRASSQIPFTTGILVGIGEDRADRIEALEAIAASHRRHGHVQEVIVQNFLPKAGTAMHAAPPCPPDDFLQAIALARLILPAGDPPPGAAEPLRRLRPPARRRHRRLGRRLAGHRRPRQPRAPLAGARPAARGHRGDAASRSAPRLTIYPEFALDPERWLDPGTALRACSTAATPRASAATTPAACSRSRSRPPSTPAPAPRSCRSAGATRRGTPARRSSPPTLVPASGRRGWHGPVGEVLEGVLLGQEVGEDEIITLFSARGPEVAAVAQVADELRRAVVGDAVTYVRNRNINYTNVCTFKCRFCGFSKGPLSLNLRGTPYLLTLEDIQERVVEAVADGATEVCLQGGIHPDFDGDYYIDVARAVHEVAPGHPHPRLHRPRGHRGRQAARTSRWPTTCAGSWTPACKTLPGHRGRDPRRPGARAALPRQDQHRGVARGPPHRPLGRAALERHDHVRRRSSSPAAGPATSCAPAPCRRRPAASPSSCRCRSCTWRRRSTCSTRRAAGPTFREALLMHAVGRIAYRGWIDNIQVSWVKMGHGGAAQILQAGANDLGGTLMDENISRAAGASHGTMMDEAGVPGLGRAARPHASSSAPRSTAAPPSAALCRSRSRPPVLVELGLDVADVLPRARQAEAPDAPRGRHQRPAGRQPLPAGVVRVARAAAAARGHVGHGTRARLTARWPTTSCSSSSRPPAPPPTATSCATSCAPPRAWPATTPTASTSRSPPPPSRRCGRRSRCSRRSSDSPKVTIFGSARTRTDDPLYEQARRSPSTSPKPAGS